MKVKEMVLMLSNLDQESELQVHLRDGDGPVSLEGLEYILAEPTVDPFSGWKGLIVIELGDIVGEG